MLGFKRNSISKLRAKESKKNLQNNTDDFCPATVYPLNLNIPPRLVLPFLYQNLLFLGVWFPQFLHKNQLNFLN